MGVLDWKTRERASALMFLAVGQGEVEPAEEQAPARLTGSQPLGVPDIGQVLVVRPGNYGLLGPLQPVAPLGEGGVDSQELLIAHVIVRLCW